MIHLSTLIVQDGQNKGSVFTSPSTNEKRVWRNELPGYIGLDGRVASIAVEPMDIISFGRALWKVFSLLYR